MRLMSRVVLAVAATVIAVPVARAQTSFGVAAGAALPLGNFGDAVDMGYNLTASLGLNAPMLPVGVRIEGMYNGFSYKSSTGVSGSPKILAGTVNATLSSATMIPMGYLIGGLGMYHFDSDIAGASTSNKVGFNIGAGWKLPLTGFSARVEARYHHVSTEGSSTSFIPITFGVAF